MAEKVEIVGGGDFDGAVLQNAASEATLLRLVEALEKQQGGGTAGAGGAGAATKLQQLATEAQKKNTVEIDKGTKKTKENTKELTNFGKGLKDASAKLASLAGSAIATTFNALGGLTSELLIGGDRLGDFSKHLTAIPVVGGLFNALAGFLDKNIDTYRSLSQVGATFGNDLFKMRQAAAEAGMPLDKFAAQIQQNANLLAVFGASSSEGAKRFGEVSKGLRTGKIGQQLMAMGFTAEDVNESLISYMDIQSRNGRLERMSTQQLTQEAGAYAMEMDKLARMTGIQRKELEKAVQANQTDARMRAMRSKLEGEALRNFDASMALVDKQLPGLSGALKDLSDGVANTEEGQKLLAIGGTEFADLMSKAGKGMISPQELQNGLARLGPRLEKYAASIGDAGLQALEKTQPALYAVLSNAHELNRLTNKNNQQLTAEQKAREGVTAFLGQFEQAIASIRGVIESSILKSAVFERIKKLLGDFSDKGGSAMKKFADFIGPVIDNILGSLEKFLLKIKEVGFEKAISDLFTSAKEKITGVLGDAFMSMITSPAVIKGLVLALGALFAAKAATSFVGGLAGAAGSKLAGGGAAPAAGGGGGGLGKMLGGVGEGIGGVLKGLASGIAAFANPAILVGAGILGASITLIGAGIAGAVWLTGKALPTFAEGLKSFADIDGGNLVSVAKGVGALGLAMGAFGAGSALGAVGSTFASISEGIGGFFGAKSPIEKLKEFAAIGPGLQQSASGFESFSRAMVSFNDGMLTDETLARMDIGTAKFRSLSAQVNATADAFKKMEPSTLDKVTDKIASVADSLKNVGSDITASVSTFFGGDKKKSQEQLLSDLGTKLDMLNMNMAQLVDLQSDATSASMKTAKYTRQARGSLV